MRNVRLVKTPNPPSLRSRLTHLIANFGPRWLYLELMKHTFINFGVETTNICNANCSFCGYRFMKRPKATMKFNIYEKAIEEFAINGGGNLNFTPTVGDPLVDTQIIPKIKLARKFKQIRDIFLYTNGILLDRTGYDTILKSGLTRLAISTFIGSAEGYHRFYGSSQYNKVVRNIIGIARANKQLGYPVRITLHLRVEGERSLWETTDIYKTIAELIDVSDIDYLDVYDAWGGLIQEDDIPDGTTLDTPLSVEEKSLSPCFELYRRLHVLADGQVGACVCVDLESEIKLGDLATETLSDIWSGERLWKYRVDWKTGILPKVCQTCTRYQSVDLFIANNKKRILIDYTRRRFPGVLNFLLKVRP